MVREESERTVTSGRERTKSVTGKCPSFTGLPIFALPFLFFLLTLFEGKQIDPRF